MRVKKFVAESLKSATDRMRSELGAEAIVLSTRTVPRGGVFSFGGREMVEITAAIDDTPLHPGGAHASRSHGAGAYRAAAGGSRGRNAVQTEPAEPPALAQLRDIAREAGGATTDRHAPGRSAGADVHLLRQEVQGIKASLQEIAGYLKYSRMPSLPTALADAYRTLVTKGVDAELAAEIVQSVYRGIGDAELDNETLVSARVLEELAAAFRTAPATPAGRRVVALVGPTGVGKTTTIAKLAALSKLTGGRAVGLVSADTYRIGAIEQLRTFAGIADIPMEVAYEPAEVSTAMNRFKEKDVVYLDTVGRSQRGGKDLAELKQFVEAARPDEVHLVLSSPTGVETQLEVIERFSVLRPNRLLFSKLDETAAPGPLIRIARETGLPVSYVTTGQTVPDDIQPADARTMAAMVYTGMPTHA